MDIIKRELNNERRRLISFDNAQELVAFAKRSNKDVEGADRGVSGARDLSRKDGNARRWTFGDVAIENGIGSHSEIHDAIAEGRTLPNLADEIIEYRKEIAADMMDCVNTVAKSVKRRRTWTEDGSELDIDRVMSGDPDYWVKTQRDGIQRIVRLCINVSASGDNSERTFVKTVALAYVTAEILERLGHGVEIHLVCSSHKHAHSKLYKERMDEEAVAVPVKKSQEPLDVNRIGFGAMSGYLRAVIPSIVCGVEKKNIKFNGECQDTSKEMQAMIGSDMLVETMWSEGKQKRTIKKLIKDLS